MKSSYKEDNWNYFNQDYIFQTQKLNKNNDKNWLDIFNSRLVAFFTEIKSYYA